MPTTRSGMEDYTCWICHLGRETVNLTFIPMLDISDILTLLAWGILLFSDSGLTFPVALPWIRFQRQKCWEELPKWQRQPLVTSLLIFKCMFLLLRNYFRCIHVKWVWEHLLLLATDSFSVVAGRLCYLFPFFFFYEESEKILIPTVSWNFPSVLVWRKRITAWGKLGPMLMPNGGI